MNHTLSKKALQALVAHASTYPGRTTIHGVYASLDGSVLVATDGHSLLLRHDPDAGVGGLDSPTTYREGRLLDLRACERAIKLCSARGQIEIDAGTRRITVRDGDQETEIDASPPGDDVGYPRYDHVIPEGDRAGTDGILVNPRLLARMLSSLAPGRAGAPRIRLGFGDLLDPIRVDANGPDLVDDARWIGVIMPMKP